MYNKFFRNFFAIWDSFEYTFYKINELLSYDQHIAVGDKYDLFKNSMA
jgi:hypothetical protein